MTDDAREVRFEVTEKCGECDKYGRRRNCTLCHGTGRVSRSLTVAEAAQMLAPFLQAYRVDVGDLTDGIDRKTTFAIEARPGAQAEGDKT